MGPNGPSRVYPAASATYWRLPESAEVKSTPPDEQLCALSVSLEPGEIFGVLGPNGAGKTTTVECIGGLRQRDGGIIRVAGMDPARAQGFGTSVGHWPSALYLIVLVVWGAVTSRLAIRFFSWD